MSGVGTLNYLVKLSRPDLANSVRELSKGMKNVSLLQLTHLFRCVRYVRNTSHLGIVLNKRTTQEDTNGYNVCTLHTYVDSDWATDEKIGSQLPGTKFFYRAVYWRGNLGVKSLRH